MFDLLLTLVLVYAAYRAYQWYQGVQERAKQPGPPPPKVELDDRGTDPLATYPGDGDDYIEYEEIKEERNPGTNP